MAIVLTLILVALALVAMTMMAGRKRRQNEDVAEMARRATEKAAGVTPEPGEPDSEGEDRPE